MIILTTFYNAENYLSNCINSIKTQTIKEFKCFLIDDVSSDNSYEVASKLIDGDDRFVLIKNTEKKYKTANYVSILNERNDVDDNDVVIELDGDDWFSDGEVLSRVKKVYSNNRIWITNGCFKYASGNQGFSLPQIDFDNLRTSRFTASHLRTWKVFLWRAIREDDHKDDDGNFLKINADLAYMLPMLEMSGPDHYRYIPDINIIYNELNPINDHKVDMNQVNIIAEQIRKRKKYKKLVR
jgi:glycosyltransferase involved in cell wall biosynthesis